MCFQSSADARGAGPLSPRWRAHETHGRGSQLVCVSERMHIHNFTWASLTATSGRVERVGDASVVACLWPLCSRLRTSTRPPPDQNRCRATQVTQRTTHFGYSSIAAGIYMKAPILQPSASLRHQHTLVRSAVGVLRGACTSMVAHIYLSFCYMDGPSRSICSK